MTNRSLNIFLTVAGCGSMSEAARRLYVSQSSVSQAIAEIEKEYGVLLFERQMKSLMLTPAGKELLRYAGDILQLHAEMETRLRDNSGKEYLRIGASPTVGMCYLPDVILKLRQSRPNIEADVRVDSTRVICELLLKSKLDVALLEGIVDSGELAKEPVIEDNMVIICGRSHPLWGRESVKLAELSGQSLILRELGKSQPTRFELALLAKKVSYHTAWRCTSYDAVLSAVKAGLGLGFVTRSMALNCTQSGELWMLGVEDMDSRRVFNLVYEKNRAGAPAFEEFCRQCRSIGGLKEW